MNELTVLKTCLNFNGHDMPMYQVILCDDQEMILVDCGYPGFVSKIREAALTKGLDIENLTKIIVTHHDFDHAGGLHDFKSTFPHIKVLTSVIQAPFIDGSQISIREHQQQNDKKKPPDDIYIKRAISIHENFGSPSFVPVDILLHDYEILPWCGGIEIIPTPGHMPGHISLYLKEFKALIAGDALVIRKGNLELPNPGFTIDMKTAIESIKQLLDYDIQKIICYHGGIYDHHVKESLLKILKM